VTAEIAARWNIACRILPVSDDPISTRVELRDGGEIDFQEYFVKLGHDVPVRSVRFAGAESARPAPGVVEAIETAEVVVIAPSNPIVSIDPILAVPRVEGAVASRRDTTVAVSPIVAGAALKGPADRMLRELGEEATVVGVARHYQHLVSALVIDRADIASGPDVEATGLRAVVTSTIMSSPDVARDLALETVEAARAT
jgi:LPPG:FO 2-phospho-L-lactate transferase